MLWIVLPTRNEEVIVEQNLDRLLAFCRDAFTETEWHVIVADNASTDATRAVVQRCAARDPNVELLTFEQQGKGEAVLGAWKHALISPPPSWRGRSRGGGIVDDSPSTSGRCSRTTPSSSPSQWEGEKQASVFAFLDADLATDLRHLPELIAAVRDGADIAAASRYLPGSRVTRSVFRTIVSRANRLLLRTRFMLRMTDPPCGMKAVSARVVHDIVPLIRDTQWFFDTELCIRAQRAGLRIVEIPVTWREPRATHGSIRKVLYITIANMRAMRTV